MKSVICEVCGEIIILTGENIGKGTSYYGGCGNCKTSYWEDRDGRTNVAMFKKFTPNIADDAK